MSHTVDTVTVMATNALGKRFRKRLNLAQSLTMFPDDKTAKEWFNGRRRPDGVRCPCGGCCNIGDGAAHRNRRFRYLDFTAA